MASEPLVTIAIPTCNRADMLARSLKSALQQDFADLRILILDNASSDSTAQVVHSFRDSRIEYRCNETNIGLFRNWNLALELNRSRYICLLQDDDEMLPGFVSKSVQALENDPEAAFSYTDVRFIDVEGTLLHRQHRRDVPAGRINGLELLHRVVAGDNWVIHASSTMMRDSALHAVGPFDVAHSRHAIEFNLYFRLAARFDFVFIATELMHVRLHEGQDHKTSTGGTGPLAMLSERFDAIAYLLQSGRAADASYRKWLADRLLTLSMARSELTAQLVPELNLGWEERMEILKQEVSALIPPGERVVLVDENQWGAATFPTLDTVPYVERDGGYWGPPDDDESGILELERLRSAGANYLLAGWPAFWLLDYYSGLRDYLQAQYRCITRNSRLVLYDLRAATGKQPGDPPDSIVDRTYREE